MGLKLVNLSSAHNFCIPCHLDAFLFSSMKHVVFQLFLIKFDIWAFSICVVSCMGTFSSLIEILIFDFHIAHMVIEINIFILSESLFVSFSKVRAANPQIRPRVMGSQSLSVDLRQIFLVVSHAWA